MKQMNQNEERFIICGDWRGRNNVPVFMSTSIRGTLRMLNFDRNALYAEAFTDAESKLFRSLAVNAFPDITNIRICTFSPIPTNMRKVLNLS